MIDFWNNNLHPITMYKKEQEKQIDNYKGRIPLGNLNFDNCTHIYSTEAMKLTGERAKNLKKKITNLEGKVYVHFSKTTYLLSDVLKIKEHNEQITRLSNY